ncbi:hypothetical protein [Actinoplanes awajinensis]|uniref:Uncharacterized protein n=1 Tax=Actinoplanes awajinensis subsp. mycoplanecinus TaxID=135947 RepID=A0A101JLP5_9ACTN|nr:hypothetical protein [Actinoplanes awajinensis]KUL29189.1 hypothetical protein ADL15_28940 [Actinoplanes awajinensis subsp. mycoplanecinus]
MPVSKKRKKPSKPNAAAKAARLRAQRPVESMMDVDSRVRTDRERFDAARREASVAPAAALVAELTALAASRSDVELADELCARLGPLLSELDARKPVTRMISPDIFAGALAQAATANDGPDAPRVLSALAGVLPQSFTGAAAPPVGETRWTRDRYGSRYGITASFPAGDGERWYLWDVDTCALLVATVHSGFYPTAEDALAAWQQGVGEFAAAGTTWGEIDDRALLRKLLPVSEGDLRMGGETADQFAEYHRCRRLAESLLQLPAPPPAEPADAASLFSAWLTERGTTLSTDDVHDVAASLTEIWGGARDISFDTFSPHRVAYTKQYVHDDYDEAYGSLLLATLPEWIRWLASTTGAEPELLDRALEAVETAVYDDNPLACVVE